MSEPPARARPAAAPDAGDRSVFDEAMLRILLAPPAPGETLALAFRRKEHELGALFAALSVMEARALHARLASPRPGDAIAARFATLVIERRARLLAFLADARRREACRVEGRR